ncbi:MAG: sulfotransferase [Parcubacteria group bacterium]|nr:sulfotransferase [Parcubacteria group bacterium]
MEPKRAQRPVIIVGSTRSGTKLISRIIGGHPDNFLITEHREKFHIPEDRSGICEEFLWMNNFAYSSWRRDGNPHVRVPLYNEEDIAVMRDIYLRAAGNKRLVIKNPQNVMRVQFLKKMFPNALYIFCVRNPWHGAQSRLLAGNANYQLASQKNFELPDDLLLKSVYSWKESIDLYQREKNENWHAVRYEDVVFNTRETVKKVFDFLGMRQDGAYFEKACAVSRDLGHRYYPMKRAFRRSKHQKEIVELVQEGCKVFPYDASIDSVPGDSLHYYVFEKDIVDAKKVKARVEKFAKRIVKKIVRAIFYAAGGGKKLSVGPLVFGALSQGESTLITQEDERLKGIVASAKKGERVSFMTLQMQYYRLRNYQNVIVMDSKGEPWVLLKNIAFSPARRYAYTLSGDIVYIKHV